MCRLPDIRVHGVVSKMMTLFARWKIGHGMVRASVQPISCKTLRKMLQFLRVLTSSLFDRSVQTEHSIANRTCPALFRSALMLLHAAERNTNMINPYGEHYLLSYHNICLVKRNHEMFIILLNTLYDKALQYCLLNFYCRRFVMRPLSVSGYLVSSTRDIIIECSIMSILTN